MILNGGSIDIGPELLGADAAIDAFYPGTLGAGIVANSVRTQASFPLLLVIPGQSFNLTDCWTIKLFANGEHFNRWGRMPFTTYSAGFVYETSMMEHDLSVAPGRTHQYVHIHTDWLVFSAQPLNFSGEGCLKLPESAAASSEGTTQGSLLCLLVSGYP